MWTRIRYEFKMSLNWLLWKTLKHFSLFLSFGKSLRLQFLCAFKRTSNSDSFSTIFQIFLFYVVLLQIFLTTIDSKNVHSSGKQLIFSHCIWIPKIQRFNKPKKHIVFEVVSCPKPKFTSWHHQLQLATWTLKEIKIAFFQLY